MRADEREAACAMWGRITYYGEECEEQKSMDIE